MRIRSKGRLVTLIALAAIALNAAVVWWTFSEVEDANRERREASDIARSLSELRLITFEYRLYHKPEAVEQWYAVSDRVNHVIADAKFSDPIQRQIIAGLRERRKAAPRIFGEIVAARAIERVDDTSRAVEARALSRLVSDQQKGFQAAFRLIDLATQRIDRSQKDELIATVIGLVLIAAVTIIGFFVMDRHVLVPVARLQHATQQIAGGNWRFSAGIAGNDEIGDLSRNFDAMVTSLHESFARIDSDRAELVGLNKELDAFSYSVSHDLRAPLRAIEGFTRIVGEQHVSQLSPEGRRLFERIQSNTRGMAQLIDDLLAFSRIGKQPINRRPADLREILDHCLEGMEEEIATRKIEIRIGGLPKWPVDSSLMSNVFQNLLSNALKYTRGRDNARVEIDSEVTEGELRVYVRDNGAGFDMKYADKLFGVFQRLHSAAEFEGTGVGLAIVQRIVQRHGGRIWAESKPDEGATFWFTLGEKEAHLTH